MESSSPTVPFPLLQTPIESKYRVCTIPYRFPSDNPRKATPVEIQWIDLFLNSVPSFRQRAENDPTVIDAPIKAEKFAQRYTAMLEDMKKNPESNGGPPDCVVLRELGFRDIFKKVKDEENAKAISLFEGVVRLNDAIEDDSKRVENLIRGILAGNIFDLGSAQLAEVFAKDGMSFLASCQNLVSRPWVIDDLDDFKMKWTTKTWKKLKDENGQLMGVDASGLLIANSGNDLPVIDLSNVSPDLAYLASDADLVILEGMVGCLLHVGNNGEQRRAIETNLYAQLKCDSIKIGMVKHPEVAQFLGGRLYDCVFKYHEVLNY
ncbi:AT hook motif domain containing protein [Musa troglodytarum]|uniref:AT hook motif domain containing protein n=1 Tax=Musa troglodytarum TaxID=320322 RepID=A0A9E7I6B1_9LILI|nr:AT hook motif domain containing protein [Musa troglodytarum]